MCPAHAQVTPPPQAHTPTAHRGKTPAVPLGSQTLEQAGALTTKTALTSTAGSTKHHRCSQKPARATRKGTTGVVTRSRGLGCVDHTVGRPSLMKTGISSTNGLQQECARAHSITLVGPSRHHKTACAAATGFMHPIFCKPTHTSKPHAPWRGASSSSRKGTSLTHSSIRLLRRCFDWRLLSAHQLKPRLYNRREAKITASLWPVEPFSRAIDPGPRHKTAHCSRSTARHVGAAPTPAACALTMYAAVTQPFS
jgi:hypothetical protein